MKKVQLKDVLVEVVKGNREAVSELVTFKDNWVSENVKGKDKRYLKRETVYTVYGINKLYISCLENFSKLTKMEIESLFQLGLYDFAYNVITEKNPLKVEELPESALVNWASKHIKGFILQEMDKSFGKININKETGEVIDREITIQHESLSGDSSVGEDEDTSDNASLYEKVAFEQWERKNLYMSFSSFIQDMNMEIQIKELLSETELVVYPKLIEKYQIENQKMYGNSHIAEELKVSEGRIRQIEQKIGDKLFKLYTLWKNTKKRKENPLSHEIRDFLEMFTHVVDSVDDENLQFEMFIGWMKTQIEKEKQVSIEWLASNKKDDSMGIIELICDNDTKLKEVLLSLDKQLHKSTYTTVCGLLEGTIDKNTLRKDSKRTIITKCLNVFYGYLDKQDKDIKRIVQYNNTYKMDKKKDDYINKGHLVENHFNSKVKINNNITE